MISPVQLFGHIVELKDSSSRIVFTGHIHDVWTSSDRYSLTCSYGIVKIHVSAYSGVKYYEQIIGHRHFMKPRGMGGFYTAVLTSIGAYRGYRENNLKELTTGSGMLMRHRLSLKSRASTFIRRRRR